MPRIVLPKTKEVKGKIVTFTQKDFKAIEINGKTKIVHNLVAQKLIAQKLATDKKDVDFSVEQNNNRTSKEVKK